MRRIEARGVSTGEVRQERDRWRREGEESENSCCSVVRDRTRIVKVKSCVSSKRKSDRRRGGR